MTQEESKKSFKDTLNLPHTDFPIRPNHLVEDEQLLKRWQDHDLYYASFMHNKGEEKYILHDGPPYANGNIHLGHAYNKILKDILCKAYRMAGYHVPVTPGWDCHGLPIEMKVAQENPGLDRTALKKACRNYANKWIDIQRASFKALGVLMDWDNPYITMSPHYEAATIKSFGILVQKGFIERKNKTVPWCFHDQTVLASAEIEYKDRKDPSIYVLFDIDQQDSARLFPALHKPVSIAVWTTTPWTLPLNQAVLARRDAQYVLLELDNKFVIVGAQVADKLCERMGLTKNIVQEFSGDYLANSKLKHPFINKYVPILFDESVGLTEGTAFVHCAPGCGPLDYEIGVKNNLDIFSPITSDGKYAQAIEPTELRDMPVTEGQIWVIKKLAELNKLLFKTTITHSYPHCWRCHNGLIFRATPQWFFDLNRQGIKQQALQAIENINFIPDRSRNFLKATVENRWEWCLSRQRVWGVPIPALLCKRCDYSYLSEELINKVADGTQQEGIEYWDRVAISDLIDSELICPNCKVADFKKEQDILDVWFDAGVSHYAVLYNNPQLSFPADIYLEGVDQHRGWFQSSLLTSLVLEEEPCMKAIMTHGYTVDAKGQKMSKSLGNVVLPQDLIKQMGTDGLRLWVASIGHDSDPVVSDVLVKNVAEVYRKIRNTSRFLLSNLYDFDIAKDALQPNSLLPLDQYALRQLYYLNNTIIDSYLAADFTAVFHALAQYCSVELSAFYLDIIKDRLYVERPDGIARRSAQTVLWYILDTLNRLTAPILSFNAEYVSDYYQKDKTASIHLQSFVSPVKFKEFIMPAAEPLWPGMLRMHVGHLRYLETDLVQKQQEELYNLQWQTLKDIRTIVLKAIEQQREKGLIKHSLEAQVKLYIDFKLPEFEPVKLLLDAINKQGHNSLQFLKEFFIVSQFTLTDSSQDLDATDAKGIYIQVTHADGVKCPRCWQWDVTANPDHLCKRCERVLTSK